MQCVTPMFRLYDISTKETVRIVPRSEVMQGLELDENNIRFQLSKMNAHYLARNQLMQTIPCRKCWACQLNYSAEWATRIMLETQNYDNCYFITLTYDDENLPIFDSISYQNKIFENDGTWIEGSLAPEHVTRFFKSWRKELERKGITGCKMFYCGEYGTQTHRPHYHLITFGFEMDLSQNYSYHIDENFKEHWKNPTIDKFWPYGMHDIANVEWSNAAYVARYCTKKLNTEVHNEEWYAEQGKIPEFIRMSKGIGKRYYEANKHSIYKLDSMVMKTVKGNTGNFKPPKSFDKWFKEEFPEEFEKIEKKRRECAERSRHNTLRKSSYTDLERLKQKAENVITKGNMLKREL